MYALWRRMIHVLKKSSFGFAFFWAVRVMGYMERWCGDWGQQREKWWWNLTEITAHDWVDVFLALSPTCCQLSPLCFVTQSRCLAYSWPTSHFHLRSLSIQLSHDWDVVLACFVRLVWLIHLITSIPSCLPSHLIHTTPSHLSCLVSSCITLSLPYHICPIVFASFTWSLQSPASTMVAIHNLSITAHLAGFQVRYMLGSRMSFYLVQEQC